MFQILIAILVIVLLLLLGIVWFQRRAIQQISELQAVSAHLSKQPLAANLKKAQQMQLVGMPATSWQSCKRNTINWPPPLSG